MISVRHLVNETLDHHLFGSICKEICQFQWITTLPLLVQFEHVYMVFVSLKLVNVMKNTQ